MADPKPYKAGNRYYIIDKGVFEIVKVQKMGGQIERWHFDALEWSPAPIYVQAIDRPTIFIWNEVELDFSFVVEACREINWLEILVVTGQDMSKCLSYYRTFIRSDK